MVALAGATMVWLWAPPSDQVWKAHDPPLRCWGVGALSELADPSITVRVNAAVAVSPLNVS